MLGQMKQMMEIKKQAEVLKRQLDEMVVEVKESGITVQITGSQDFRDIAIDDALWKDQDKQKMEAALLRSINAAVKKSQAVASERMASVMPKF